MNALTPLSGSRRSSASRAGSVTRALVSADITDRAQLRAAARCGERGGPACGRPRVDVGGSRRFVRPGTRTAVTDLSRLLRDLFAIVKELDDLECVPRRCVALIAAATRRTSRRSTIAPSRPSRSRRTRSRCRASARPPATARRACRCRARSLTRLSEIAKAVRLQRARQSLDARAGQSDLDLITLAMTNASSCRSRVLLSSVRLSRRDLRFITAQQCPLLKATSRPVRRPRLQSSSDPLRRRCRGGQPVGCQGRGDRADSAVHDLGGRRLAACRLHAQQHDSACA